jgi:hypothetical protein
MLNSKIMKTIRNYILIGITLLSAVGCDKDFVKINTNPLAVNTLDPSFLLAGAQRSHLGTWYGEHVIVQQFVVPYNEGATLGFSLNENIDGMSNPKWDQSYPQVRNINQAMELLGADTERVNLMSMLRIWKAQIFMGLVDDYGDVPYFNAGKGLVRETKYFYPEYDDDAVIYQDLYTELTGAIAALRPDADFVSADLFYGTNAQVNKTTTAADQVAKWKKLGNSLLLRLGMRYSKVDTDKARSIVEEAFAGGVMTSNADNAYVKYDGTVNVHLDNNALRNFSQYNYAAEPFVNQLKSTNDPRGKFIVAMFSNPGAVGNESNPDTDLTHQFGVPIGVNDAKLKLDPYRKANPKGGLNYSQMNVWRIASPAAPEFYVTYAQTSLLLAEAAQRGWVSGSAQTYYEDAIRADMNVYQYYPGSTAVPEAEILAYLAEPGVVFNPNNEDAFRLINTQYWLVNIRNGTEAFANFRRSGYPALSPNLFNNKLNGGFVRRLSYPDKEGSANSANYTAASLAIGGDNLMSRVFWDIP